MITAPRVGRTHGWPVAEVPGFQFFDGDAVHHLKVAIRLWRRSGPESGALGSIVQLPLQRAAIVVVPIHDHQDHGRGRQPLFVATQTVRQLPEQIPLVAELAEFQFDVGTQQAG